MFGAQAIVDGDDDAGCVFFFGDCIGTIGLLRRGC